MKFFLVLMSLGLLKIPYFMECFGVMRQTSSFMVLSIKLN